MVGAEPVIEQAARRVGDAGIVVVAPALDLFAQGGDTGCSGGARVENGRTCGCLLAGHRITYLSPLECGGLTPLLFGVRRLDAAFIWSAAARRRFYLECGGSTPLWFFFFARAATKKPKRRQA